MYAVLLQVLPAVIDVLLTFTWNSFHFIDRGYIKRFQLNTVSEVPAPKRLTTFWEFTLEELPSNQNDGSKHDTPMSSMLPSTKNIIRYLLATWLFYGAEKEEALLIRYFRGNEISVYKLKTKEPWNESNLAPSCQSGFKIFTLKLKSLESN